MQLAAAPIIITMDGEAFALRPSLRVAYILERRHTYAGILSAITDLHTSIIADVVELGSGTMQARSALAADIDRHGASILIKLRPALMSFLTALIGVDESDEQPASNQSTTKQTFAALYERLFAIGTGWLDWTPEQTWHATPAEISAAYHGKLDYLKTIYGSAEGTSTDSKPDNYNAERLREIEEQGFDPAFDRDAFHAFKANIGSAA